MVRRLGSAKVLARLQVLALVILVACGPPLTQPSSQNITGHWASTQRFFALSDVRLDITQASDGTLGGTWSSNVSPPHPNCPPDVSDVASGPVQGTNTVLGATFGLVGAGDFQGQADDGALRGSFVTCGFIFPITFTRVGTAPAG
jgi:hypothetical protein